MSIDPFEYFEKYGVLSVFFGVLALFIIFIGKEVIKHAIEDFRSALSGSKTLRKQVKKDISAIIAKLDHIEDAAVNNGAKLQALGFKKKDLAAYNDGITKNALDAHKRLLKNFDEIERTLPKKYQEAVAFTSNVHREFSLNSTEILTRILNERDLDNNEEKVMTNRLSDALSVLEDMRKEL